MENYWMIKYLKIDVAKNLQTIVWKLIVYYFTFGRKERYYDTVFAREIMCSKLNI